jgi:hypothetical protein
MSLPYPEPTTRQQARANVGYYTELADDWGRIADGLPTEEPQDTEETFQAWAARQIEKVSEVLQETMNRVDRLESSLFDRVQSGREAVLTKLELQMIDDIREGRLVTHTPDYIAGLRRDAISDEERGDLDGLRSGEVVTVTPSYIDEHSRLIDRVKELEGARRVDDGRLASPDPDTAMVALTPVDYGVIRAVVVRAVSSEKGRAIIVDQKDMDQLKNIDVTVRKMTLGPHMWQVRIEPKSV